MSTTILDSDLPGSGRGLLRKALELAVRFVVETALALHLVGAGFYWWLSPQGYPIDHSRFWINSVLPIVAMVVATVGLMGMLRRCYWLAALAVLCFTCAWAAGAVAGRIIFPMSLRWLWFFPLTIATGGGVCFWLLILGNKKTWLLWISAAVISALIAVGIVRSEVPPPPSTRPVNELPPSLAANANESEVSPTVALGEGRTFYPAVGEFVLNRGGVTICCSPLMEFDRTSPDGFWSILAPFPAGTQRRLEGASISDSDSRSFRYSDGSVIVVPSATTEGAIDFVAYTRLAKDTFSHLNTYAVLRVSGHRRLLLSFSPCPETKIEVLPADYPFGRPARFAYLDDSDVFRVVEATSAEKGPFYTLALGSLHRGESLSISLYDEEKFIVAIVLKDWSQQASTMLSPTAGWGVPMNSVEFQRSGDDADTPVTIWISLAATSVDRGWDSVGHRAGTYRNRIVFSLEAL